jgi:hypothetical protein
LWQCAGFLPKDPRYAELLERARVALPTLFTMGEGDTIITLDRSQALADTFDKPGVYTHPGEWGGEGCGCGRGYVGEALHLMLLEVGQGWRVGVSGCTQALASVLG